MKDPLDIPVEADETEEIEHRVKDEDRWEHPRHDKWRPHPEGAAILFYLDWFRRL